MRILEEFWYGNVNPNEQLFDRQSRFAKVMRLLTQNEGKLLERLNAEGKEILKSIRTAIMRSRRSANVKRSSKAFGSAVR